MEKREGIFGTIILLSDDDVKDVCKFGKGSECCAFIAMGGDGFFCTRMDAQLSSFILKRLENNSMNAKGVGGWAGCAWEGKISLGD